MVKNKSDFNLPVQKDRDGRRKLPGGSFVRVCMASDFFVDESDTWRIEAWDFIRRRTEQMVQAPRSGPNHPAKKIEAEVAAIYKRKAAMKAAMEAKRKPREKVKEIADEKCAALSPLALARSLAKYDHVQSLVGTTDPAHLQESIDALKIELTAEDIFRMEAALDADQVSGKGMRNFVFTDGVMSLTQG